MPIFILQEGEDVVLAFHQLICWKLLQSLPGTATNIPIIKLQEGEDVVLAFLMVFARTNFMRKRVACGSWKKHANTQFKLLCMLPVCKILHGLSEDSRRRKVVGHDFEKCRNSFPTKSLARHGTRHWQHPLTTLLNFAHQRQDFVGRCTSGKLGNSKNPGFE